MGSIFTGRIVYKDIKDWSILIRTVNLIKNGIHNSMVLIMEYKVLILFVLVQTYGFIKKKEKEK